MESGAKQSSAAEESNSLPLAFSSFSCFVRCSVSFLSCCARLFASSIFLSKPGSRRQLSNCYAEAFGYDNHNRQRVNDEPNAPLLVEVDAAAEEVDMVVGAVLNSGATYALKITSASLFYYSTSVRPRGRSCPGCSAIEQSCVLSLH